MPAKRRTAAQRDARVRSGKASVTKSLRAARKQGLITRSDVKKTRRSLKATGNRARPLQLAGASSQGKRTNFAKNLVRQTKSGRAQNRARGEAGATVRRGSQAAKRGQTVGTKLGSTGRRRKR